MSNSYSRRDFVKRSAGAAVGVTVPYFLSSPSALADETPSKNDRLRLGLIGAGGMGRGNLSHARRWGDTVAIADVDANHANHANRKLSQGKADIYSDYRDLLERDDLDAIHIATPDHWHTKQLAEAMLAGFDVYCEKPLTLTIDEGKLLQKLVKETGRIVQVGTQQRSTFDLFTKAVAMVAEGRVGKIKHIQTAFGGGGVSPALPVAEIPSTLNWDRWLGPAPLCEYRFQENENGKRPFTNAHYEFRWWYDFSGGKLSDWGAHHVDIAMWALQVNGQSTMPLSISGSATHPVPFRDGYPVEKDKYNTATEFKFLVQFPEDVELTIRHDTDNGILIEGDQGRIFVNRNRLVGKPVEDLKENPLPEDAIQQVYKGLPLEHYERTAHWANFFHCCRERKEPISDIASHMQGLNICHLAGICGRLGRTLKWDGEKEQIVGDDQANGFLGRSYRQGYEIEM